RVRVERIAIHFDVLGQLILTREKAGMSPPIRNEAVRLQQKTKTGWRVGDIGVRHQIEYVIARVVVSRDESAPLSFDAEDLAGLEALPAFARFAVIELALRAIERPA